MDTSNAPSRRGKRTAHTVVTVLLAVFAALAVISGLAVVAFYVIIVLAMNNYGSNK